MAEKKKNKSRPRSQGKKNTNRRSTHTAEITGICLAALSLVLMIFVYTNHGGKIGSAVSLFLKGAFGVGAYVAPIAAIVMIFHFMVSKRDDKKKKYIMSWVAILDFTTICHMLFVHGNADWQTYYSYSCKNPGGGFVGALVGEPLVSMFGEVCTYIILGALMAIMLILVFDISFAQLFGALVRKIQNSIEDAKSDIEQSAAEQKKEVKRHTADDVPLPEPPPENPLWEPEVPPSFITPEINIYNEKSEQPAEKISKDEKETLHKEIQSEVDSAEAPTRVYRYPELDLLTAPKPKKDGKKMSDELQENAVKLVETLRSFHVDVQVVEISCGPTVTRYEVKPAPGVKVSQITGLSKDIALKLAAKGGVMIAPVPGKSTIGIEIANANPSVVTLREVLDSDEFKNHKSKLAVALGKDISGAPVIMDLAKMPHLLIAGATGAGKSVCINTLVISLIYKADPNEVKLVMIDPKQVELGVYNGIPHLLIPVVKDAKKATGALSWAVQEMTERYSVFERNNVRNIQGYNDLMEAEGTPENKMPSIVIIIDEFADLMMVAPGDVENYVCRIAQLARAAGMHLVIATQRPVVKFITGNIKANVPSRISFMVASVKDSQTILDMGGAEKLVGRGDMLYLPVGETKPARMQCAFVSDDEVKKVVAAVTEDGEAEYDPSVIEQIEKDEEYKPDGDNPGDADELLPEAIELAIDNKQISTSLIQRRFRIGYNRAGSIIDQMEKRGIISEPDGNRPRQVLITREQYNEMLMK